MGNLKVEVVEARNLTNMDGLFGKNDAYVILKIGHQKQKTRIIANGGKNPTWNDHFEFTANPNDEISAEVWDYDRIKDDHIGTAKIPLQSIFQRGNAESWYNVSRGAKSGGELLLRFHCQG